MRKPDIDLNVIKERLKNLSKDLNGSALVVASHPEYVRNHDVHFEYRQDTNLYYLTGFEEPESVFVFRPGSNPESVLFVRERNPDKELWDGFRYGPDLAEKNFAIDKALPIVELHKELPNLLESVDKVYYRLKKNPLVDEILMDTLETVRLRRGRTGMGVMPIVDPSEVIGECRLKKSEKEIQWQKKACEISALGHIEAMKYVKPGVTEKQIEGVLRGTFMQNNSPRMGYLPIVARGSNATTLHYVYNDEECKDGDLLLIDAGTEWKYFTGDITRTFPVNGTFNAPQKEVYEHVLNVQEKLINMVKPGIAYKDLHETSVRLTAEALIDMKLIPGTVDEAVDKKTYFKYFPHSTGHWLGMDVHDAGLYQLRGESRLLEEGMCFTIEPGIYIPENDDSAPKEFRGIGVRIEDNILVTKNGHENMTQMAPKSVNELEETIKS